MIGDKIKKIRQQSSITAYSFCDKIGISRSTLSNIEKNIYSPSDDILNRIASEFNIDINEFYRETFPSLESLSTDETLHIGHKIKEIREKFNLSQEEIAEKLGYSSGAPISYIESGRRSLSRSKIITFCKMFNVPIEELMLKLPSNKKDIYISYEDIKGGDVIKKFITLCKMQPEDEMLQTIKNMIEICYKRIKS